MQIFSLYDKWVRGNLRRAYFVVKREVAAFTICSISSQDIVFGERPYPPLCVYRLFLYKVLPSHRHKSPTYLTFSTILYRFVVGGQIIGILWWVPLVLCIRCWDSLTCSLSLSPSSGFVPRDAQPRGDCFLAFGARGSGALPLGRREHNVPGQLFRVGFVFGWPFWWRCQWISQGGRVGQFLFNLF